MNSSDIWNTSFSNQSNQPFKVYINYYIEEFFLIVGLITVSVNILVFYQLRSKDTTYKFLLAEAIVDFNYLLLLSFLTFLYCGSPCFSLASSLFGQLYSLAIDNYLTSCLAFHNILIELVLSLQRLFIITNKPWLSGISFIRIYIPIVISSLIFYAPLLFLNRLIRIGSNEYSIEPLLPENAINWIVPTVLSSIRVFFATFVLFTINIVTFVHFKKHVKKKSMLTSKSSSNNLNL